MSIPHLFRCPISLDLFTDPVTLSTGQTYDRASIEKWLADGHFTCPVTMKRLDDTSLVPNHTLRHLIDQWIVDDAEVQSQSRTSAETSDHTEFSLGTLKHSLESVNTSCEQKLEMLKTIRKLSFESDIGQACLIQQGVFQVLLRLLFEYPFVVACSVLDNSEFIEVALDLVLSLTTYNQLGNLNMLRSHSNLALFVMLLDRGNAKIKTSLCCLLEAIATASVTEDLCVQIGKLQSVWQILISLLHKKIDDRPTEAAARVVASLCSSESNRAIAIREGTVDGLISYLQSSTRKNSSLVLQKLEIFAQSTDGKRALMKNRNTVPLLVKFVFSVSSDHEGSEHAVGTLMLLCCSSASVRAEAVNAGLLLHLLLLLQSQCSSNAKVKARALLKLLDECGLKIKEEIYSIKGR